MQTHEQYWSSYNIHMGRMHDIEGLRYEGAGDSGWRNVRMLNSSGWEEQAVKLGENLFVKEGMLLNGDSHWCNYQV